MSELLTTDRGKELWFDGPNYTVDAVIIDETQDAILLIERGDGGGWALAGGFRDTDDITAEQGARREAREETGIVLSQPGTCIFRGIVDDPRNTERAWIETEAFLYTTNSNQVLQAGYDAINATWHRIAELPNLYASHQAIVDRALDYLDQQSLTHAYEKSKLVSHVDGGHMQYDKSIHSTSNSEEHLFVKAHETLNFTNNTKADRSKLYLEKEAATMSHLRLHGFSSIPDQSILHGDSLILPALRAEDGWHWRAPSDLLEPYLLDTLEMLTELEQMPIPNDMFPIEPSLDSFSKEGWSDLDEEKWTQLAYILEQFRPRLNKESFDIGHELIGKLSSLRTQALQPDQLSELVLCHHDARQSNIAWHPEKGAKLIDWSWAGYGERGSDATNLLVDLHKSGHDVTSLYPAINQRHCLKLIGFWLGHSLWPSPTSDNSVRFQQFVSAISAYDILRKID